MVRGRRCIGLALTVATLAAVAPLSPAAAGPVRCPSVSAPDVRFGTPVYVDKVRPGGEPVSQVAQDGSIIVAGHASTSLLYKSPDAAPGLVDWASQYANQTYVWRSDDHAKTWDRIEEVDGLGAHTKTSTGFSDPDFAMDDAGTIYGTEIDLVNVSVFSSTDDGRSFPNGNPIAGSGDRPWLGALGPGEVFLIINAPQQLLRSTDGGTTFEQVDTNFVADGHLWRDPLNPRKGLIGPDDGGAAISADKGGSWERYPLKLEPNEGFRTVAVDRAGWIYSASAGGYEGADDTKPDGKVKFSYFDRKTKKWAKPLNVPIPEGDVLWPWMVAGDDGRAVAVWLQSLASHPEAFYVYAAYTTNGHGSHVRCSDGSTRFVAPVFSVVNASGRPVHVGNICLQGTACNLDTSNDRRLGDYFTVNIDAEGRIFMVVSDTMLRTAAGQPKPVANPLIIRQTGGAPASRR
jgi:hypothetical protein